MLDAMSATQVAMLHDQWRLQSISQNVSNMQTPGYKRQIVESLGFDEHLNVPIQALNQSTQRLQGTLLQTNRPSELALVGEGYFEVQTQEGVFYTRRGDFHVNEEGELATVSGALLLGQAGAIRVEDNPFRVDRRGAVIMDNHPVDEIKVVEFDHPEQLTYRGEGLFESIEIPHPAEGETHVLQGHLEQSNVKSMDEMMDLVKTSRHFELSQRIMRIADGLLSSAINQLGEGNV